MPFASDFEALFSLPQKPTAFGGGNVLGAMPNDKI
jgi:hypothetical protein